MGEIFFGSYLQKIAELIGKEMKDDMVKEAFVEATSAKKVIIKTALLLLLFIYFMSCFLLFLLFIFIIIIRLSSPHWQTRMHQEGIKGFKLKTACSPLDVTLIIIGPTLVMLLMSR